MLSSVLGYNLLVFVHLIVPPFCIASALPHTLQDLTIKFVSQTYNKSWNGNCLLELQSYSERLRNARLPQRS